MEAKASEMSPSRFLGLMDAMETTPRVWYRGGCLHERRSGVESRTRHVAGESLAGRTAFILNGDMRAVIGMLMRLKKMLKTSGVKNQGGRCI